jgi:hypothetical protein
MIVVKRLVLDVLKPHLPNAVDFSKLLAEHGAERVALKVLEMDENTETVQVVVEGADIDFERLRTAIGELGASLHSIDEVEVRVGREPAA